MNVSKAIEIKSRKGQELLDTSPAEIYEADRLSKEALKREKARREGFTSIVGTLLPGETED